MRTLCRDCCETSEGAPERCPLCGSARLKSHAEMDTLAIAHVDCDAFYASVEKRDRPEIRDKPVIVGGTSGRGVVTTACYIARRFGVHSAMPMFKALELCPQATVIQTDMTKYRAVSAQIRAIFRAASEVIEPVSLDEAYLDLTHDNLLGSETAAEALALIARRVQREVGITVSIGLSGNKFLAKLASEMEKPAGYSIIGMVGVEGFLAGLPVAKINGVGTVMARRLADSGIQTIGDLQGLSEAALVARFGRFGRRLARFAHGEDERSVTVSRAAKSVSAETTLRHDTAAPAELATIASGLCERVAQALERKGVAGSTVVVKLKTSDFRILTRNKRLQHPTRKARLIYEAALPLIEREADGRRFRLVGIGVDQIVPGEAADPPDLFGES